ncbi:DUF4253 domain-containing protein [Nocardioides sp. CCNWLW239]|uniref:DUF4253 domain-containing protein n=1 Tax=Nocardioides sp. CCNWLW239 TaxID=3128902 RepID=UPI0030182596
MRRPNFLDLPSDLPAGGLIVNDIGSGLQPQRPAVGAASGVSSAMLWLSVAHPPRDILHARAVAAEHLAFCPDNIWQGRYNGIDEYATTLVGLNVWAFWWD